MISLLLINYRSAPLALDAIRSARASTHKDVQVVVVDNSQDPSEAGLLRPHADTLIAAERNLGYGAGINRGREVCRGAVIVISNPDVVFDQGSIDRLTSTLEEEGAAVAGPALFWDDGRQWHLPPADSYSGMERLDAAMASRLDLWQRWRDRRRVRRRYQFWNLQRPVRVESISGAVMAVRSDAFDRLGGFDERFFLYFEETDFLRRLRGASGSIIYEPRATCRHIFNQSAAADAAAAAGLYAQSERLYLEKWFGKIRAQILKGLEGAAPVPDFSPAPGRMEIPGEDSMLEASPLPDFATAAGRLHIRGSVSIPQEIWVAYRSRALYLRAVEPRSGRVLARWVRYRS